MTGPDEARFWAAVNKNGPAPTRRPELGLCWLWRLSVNKKRGGYGQFRLGRRTLRAHIVAYELAGKSIPDGFDLDHLCRTPRCVNPAHLEPVTRGENTRRGMAPSAISARENRCGKRHELTPENTITRPSRPGKRECRECENAAQRRRHQAQRRVA
jgi:hypothetical protein